MRCAHFLGAAGVLACDRNAAPLSPVVSKASAGALEVSVEQLYQFNKPFFNCKMKNGLSVCAGLWFRVRARRDMDMLRTQRALMRCAIGGAVHFHHA